MRSRFRGIVCALLLFYYSTGWSPPSANLLRNADFQDDWITLLPENQNHHWCYPIAHFNRRDYNPDGWICRGSWRWQDADAPAGFRRLVLQGTDARLTQRVNWVTVHDDRSLSGFPDAGGFPNIASQRSRRPLLVVRDLTFRVFLKGVDVPAGAGVIELGLCPPGGTVTFDPFGAVVPPVATATAPLPAGTFSSRPVEVTLPAASWLRESANEAKPGGGSPRTRFARHGSGEYSLSGSGRFRRVGARGTERSGLSFIESGRERRLRGRRRER